MAENYTLASKRGYFGIGIYQPKFESNVGVLWRTAYNFNADFIFTIGKRYTPSRPDVVKAYRHIPMWEYDDLDHFKLPRGSTLVGVEIEENAKNLMAYNHPERAVYLLGSEDHGLSWGALDLCSQVVTLDTNHCMNVSTTGAIVMYDRRIKQ